MTTVRRDIRALGDGWSQEILDFANAMRELTSLPISDANSWVFLAAMHGFDRQLWIRHSLIGPSVPVPLALENGPFGNQCQHGSWYFLPWHRGYLFAFESIVAATVRRQTGRDWALPYWNYLDDTDANARRIPSAFLARDLPNGSPNPLSRYPRASGLTEIPPGQNDGFSLTAMAETDFLVGANGSIGFGGGVTGNFVQFAGRSGDLEVNPHNTVHRLIGGNSGGFMADARLAALDPLFWLHHCNIDRLWEAWMRSAGKSMVRDPRWLNGPQDRSFVIPIVGGNTSNGKRFTPADTLGGGPLYRDYDNLSVGTGLTATVPAPLRVSMGTSNEQSVETVGANRSAVTVGASPTKTNVDLQIDSVSAGVRTMGVRTPGEETSRLYLVLESVRGEAPSPVVKVYVNVPDGANPLNHPELHAGSITMFGLNVASMADGGHGGSGLGYTLDITGLVKRLNEAGDFDLSRLRVTLVPGDQISDERAISIERISVLKRTGIVR